MGMTFSNQPTATPANDSKNRGKSKDISFNKESAYAKQTRDAMRLYKFDGFKVVTWFNLFVKQA